MALLRQHIKALVHHLLALLCAPERGSDFRARAGRSSALCPELPVFSVEKLFNSHVCTLARTLFAISAGFYILRTGAHFPTCYSVLVLILKNFNSDLTWISHVEPRFRMKSLSQDTESGLKKVKCQKTCFRHYEKPSLKHKHS